MSLGVQSVVCVCFFSGVLLLAAASLFAAPDPNLFDGRVAPAVPQSFEPGGSEAEGADDVVEQHAGGSSETGQSESRDFSQIDGVSVGESISAENSKSDTTLAGGGSVVNPAKTVPGAGAVSADSGDPAAAGMAGADESGVDRSSGGAASAQRRFEAFSFGVTGGESNRAVVVNRSKDITVPSSDASTVTVPSDASAPVSGNHAAGATPISESGRGDYGSHVPSGL